MPVARLFNYWNRKTQVMVLGFKFYFWHAAIYYIGFVPLTLHFSVLARRLYKNKTKDLRCAHRPGYYFYVPKPHFLFLCLGV